MTDKIRLIGLSFYGYHGVSSSEQETGRMYEVDCELESDLSQAGKTDDLDHTIIYESVYLTIKESVENKKYSLLEKLAEEISQKMRKLVEEALFKKTVENLRDFYIKLHKFSKKMVNR